MQTEIPIVTAFTEVFESLVTQATFDFQDDERAPELLGALLEPAALRSLATAYLYGFTVMEWQADASLRIKAVWELPHRTVIKARITNNQIETFTQFTDDGELNILPRWKAVYARKGGVIPYGRGILMGIATQGLRYLQNASLVSAAAEENLRNLENWFVPEELTDNDPLIMAIRQQQKSTENAFTRRIIAPSEAQDTHDAAGGERKISLRKFLREYPPRADIPMSDRMMHLQKDIAVVLGMEAYLLGSDATGSYALAEVQSGALVQHIRGGVAVVREALQEVLDLLYMWHGYGPAPEITNDWTDFVPTEALADVIVKLSQAGVNFDGAEAPLEVLRRVGLSTDGIEENEEEGEAPPAADDDEPMEDD